MPSPFFSVVIPVYNRAEMIGGTVDSVLRQDYRDFEVIIIDDGSTDDTEQIIHEKFSNNPAVRYYKQPNAERGAARNNGIKKASGQYIVLLDSDDILLPSHLITLKNAIDKNPGKNFFATKYRILSGKHYRSPDLASLDEKEYSIDLLLKGNAFSCNFCFRKNNQHLFLFEEDRRYSSMEDWMFLVQNLSNDTIYIVDAVTLTMIDHPERSMQNDHGQIIRRRMLATDWILQKIPLTEKQKRTLKAYSDYFCAVHSYLDDKKKQGIAYILKATGKTGINIRFMLLAVKIILGRKIIQKFFK